MTATPNVAPPLVPRLQTLHIFEYGLYHTDFITPSVVINMILSRWWSDAELANTYPIVSRWKKVRLGWDEGEIGWDEAQLARLLRCREEGLDVYVDGMPTDDL